jgi:hypothetical protein
MMTGIVRSEVIYSSLMFVIDKVVMDDGIYFQCKRLLGSRILGKTGNKNIK